MRRGDRRLRCRAGRRAAPRGVALLEALVALVLLGTAGSALVATLLETEAAAARAQATDRRLAAAHRFVQAVAFWSRAELDLRLGDRAQGPYRLRIGRVAPTVYTVVLADSAAPATPLVRTALYRPLADSAAALGGLSGR